MEAMSGIMEGAVEGGAGPWLTADPAAFVMRGRRVLVSDRAHSPLRTCPLRVDAMRTIVQCAVKRQPLAQVTAQLATVVSRQR